MISLRKLPFLAFSALVAGNLSANDRVLDFSTGCKIYRLENRAWVPADAAGFEGMGLLNTQILKDEKFTVFRTDQGTFGVNQKCVLQAAPADPAQQQPAAQQPPAEQAPVQSLDAPIAQEQAQPEQQPRTVTKRTRTIRTRRKSAARPSYFNNRNPWSLGLILGINISPKGERTATLGTTTETSNSNFSSSLTIAAEVDYRFNRNYRLAAEFGVSQLQQSAGVGNATSHFALRPEYVHRINPNMELYGGPLIGLFFLAQNAESTSDSGTTIEVKQQTASALLFGLMAGADYALNEQFDLGLFLRYFKPGSLTVTGTQTAPTTGSFEAAVSTSYLTFGARAMIHF